MVLIKSTTTTTSVCILLVFLCAAWLSTARLHPTGGEVNGLLSTKARVITATINKNKEKTLAAIDSKKLSMNSSKSGAHGKKSLRSHLSDEVGVGFVAFTADYHSPRHHPPKNNK